MATTTSKSNAKTKTTKTKSAKTKKTSSTKKTTPKKQANKKTISTKTTTKVVKKPASLKKQKRSKKIMTIGLFAAILAFAFAVLAWFRMSTFTVDMTVDHAVSDVIASRGGDVYASASQVLYSLQLRYVLIFALVVVGLVKLIHSTRKRTKYEAATVFGANKYRWIELGLTFALFGEVVALASGVQSMLLIKLLSGAALVYALLAWLVERYHFGKHSTKALYVASALVGLIPIGIIASFSLGSAYFGELVYPWYIYVAQLGYVLMFAAVLRTQMMQVKGVHRFASNTFIENRYKIVMILTITIVSGALIVGF